jgi:hypothetical protein
VTPYFVALRKFEKAEGLAEPAIEVPWCYYYLVEMKLYQIRKHK